MTVTDTISSNRSPHPMLLAFICNGAYAMPLATMLRSVVEHNAAYGPIEIYVLVEQFSQTLRKRVTASLPAGAASIHWIEGDLTRYSGLAATAGVGQPLSNITFARLLLPEVLPAEAAFALYLDVDMLVLRDLGALWQADLHGASIGAVRDGMDALRLGGAPAFAQVPRVRRYFNAGVLLMDLHRCRAHRVAERAHRYLRAHPGTPYADQDALNVACDGDWHELDPVWNYQTIYHPGSLDDLPTEHLPGIAHFVTGNKPWMASALNPHAGYYDCFRSRTLFARSAGERLRDGTASAWVHVKVALKRVPWMRRTLQRLTADPRPLATIDRGRT